MSHLETADEQLLMAQKTAKTVADTDARKLLLKTAFAREEVNDATGRYVAARNADDAEGMARAEQEAKSFLKELNEIYDNADSSVLDVPHVEPLAPGEQ